MTEGVQLSIILALCIEYMARTPRFIPLGRTRIK
jgi:hypothetical protein